MTPFQAPDLTVKLDAIKEAVEWASGLKTVVSTESKGQRVREPNSPWCELRFRRLEHYGADFIIDFDSDDERNPRQEAIAGYRDFIFQLTVTSRNTGEKSAWYLAEKLRTRIMSPFARRKWFKDNDLAARTLSDVTGLSRSYDGRIEGQALFEMAFFTFLIECDPAMVGTWVEHVELTSDMGLDTSLELENERIPV